jgi:alpha-glucosidase
MYKYLEKQDELTILYNNEIVIKHTKRHPAFYLGYGIEKIDTFRGNFSFDDYIEQRIGLDEYRTEDNKIIFNHQNIQLILTLEEVDNRLQIKFESTEGYNRFWFRVHASKEEKVYGCGEQASYFNLRGRNFPIWTSEPGVGRDKSSLTKFYADLFDQGGGDYYTTYYPEPTFVSTRKYWLHADTYAYSDFSFKRDTFHELFFWELPERMIMSFEGSYLNLVNDLTDFTKRVPKLPDYLLDGIILGVQGGMSKVLGYLEQALEAGVKVSGLWCQDWAGTKYTSFGKDYFGTGNLMRKYIQI